MEQTSSELKKNILPDVLEEILKPKSLSELHVKRKHNDDDDEDDEQENVHDDDDDDEENDDNEESEKDNIWKHIQSTTRLLIKDDKEELDKLIDEFKSEAGDDFADIVLELEKLVEQYLDGKVTMTDILNISRSLENSSILLSKQQRFKMLLNDIADNQHRVQTIFRRLNEAKDENTLNQLVREHLLSPEQYEKLKTHADAALDLNIIADVIKNTKIGRGLKFLPTTIDNLKAKLNGLVKDTATKGLDALKSNILAILDELLHKNGITKDEHASINNDIKDGSGWGRYGFIL